jgi:hypothetical protein
MNRITFAYESILRMQIHIYRCIPLEVLYEPRLPRALGPLPGEMPRLSSIGESENTMLFISGMANAEEQSLYRMRRIREITTQKHIVNEITTSIQTSTVGQAILGASIIIPSHRAVRRWRLVISGYIIKASENK